MIHILLLSLSMMGSFCDAAEPIRPTPAPTTAPVTNPVGNPITESSEKGGEKYESKWSVPATSLLIAIGMQTIVLIVVLIVVYSKLESKTAQLEKGLTEQVTGVNTALNGKIEKLDETKATTADTEANRGDIQKVRENQKTEKEKLEALSRSLNAIEKSQTSFKPTNIGSDLAASCDAIKGFNSSASSIEQMLKDNAPKFAQSANHLIALSAEVSRACIEFRQLLPKLTEQTTALNHARTTLEDAKAQADGKLQEAMVREEKNTANQSRIAEQAADLEARIEKTNKDIAKLESLRLKNQSQLASLNQAKAEVEAIQQAAASDRSTAETARSEAQAQLAAAERLTDAFWPDIFMKQGRLSGSRLEIQERISNGSAEAGFLLAALFRFRLAAKDAVLEEWPEVLSEVSRCAYRYWKTCGLSATQRDATARDWMSAINTQIAPHYTIKVASSGLSKDPTWMNFRPGPSPNIVEVETWAVLDPKGIAVKRAEVNLEGKPV